VGQQEEKRGRNGRVCFVEARGTEFENGKYE